MGFDMRDPAIIARERAQDQRLRAAAAKSPKLRKLLIKARRKSLNPDPVRTEKGDMKRELLREVRRATGRPQLSWGEARRWLRRQSAKGTL